MMKTPPTGPEFSARFRLQRKLGEGAMGVVFLAEELALGRPVAVKFLHETALDEATMARFFEEARALARLNHPHILKVIDCGDETGHPFIALEYVDGGSLADLVRRDGPLAIGRTTALVDEICQAMAHAHEKGILHRDLKAANILLDGMGAVRVADFGLARRADRGKALTATGTLLGTPGTMAPELIRGQGASPASDIYAAACIFFRLLTGRLPFHGESVAEVLEGHVHRRPPDPRTLRPGLDASLATALLAGLDKDPAARPANFALFGRLLAEGLERSTGESIAERTLGTAGEGREDGKASLAGDAPRGGVARDGADRDGIVREGAHRGGVLRDGDAPGGIARAGDDRGEVDRTGAASPRGSRDRPSRALRTERTARPVEKTVAPTATGTASRVRRILPAALVLLLAGGAFLGHRLFFAAPPPPPARLVVEESGCASLTLLLEGGPHRPLPWTLRRGDRVLDQGVLDPPSPRRLHLRGLRPGTVHRIDVEGTDTPVALDVATSPVRFARGVWTCYAFGMLHVDYALESPYPLRLEARVDEGPTLASTVEDASSGFLLKGFPKDMLKDLAWSLSVPDGPVVASGRTSPRFEATGPPFVPVTSGSLAPWFNPLIQGHPLPAGEQVVVADRLGRITALHRPRCVAPEGTGGAGLAIAWMRAFVPRPLAVNYAAAGLSLLRDGTVLAADGSRPEDLRLQVFHPEARHETWRTRGGTPESPFLHESTDPWSAPLSPKEWAISTGLDGRVRGNGTVDGDLVYLQMRRADASSGASRYRCIAVDTAQRRLAWSRTFDLSPSPDLGKSGDPLGPPLPLGDGIYTVLDGRNRLEDRRFARWNYVVLRWPRLAESDEAPRVVFDFESSNLKPSLVPSPDGKELWWTGDDAVWRWRPGGEPRAVGTWPAEVLRPRIILSGGPVFAAGDPVCVQFEQDVRSPGLTAVFGLADVVGRVCRLRDGVWHRSREIFLDTKVREFAPHVLDTHRRGSVHVIVERNSMALFDERTGRFNRMTSLDQVFSALAPDGTLYLTSAIGKLRAIPLSILVEARNERLW